MVIGSTGKPMDLETRLLKDAGFFNIEEPVKSVQNADRLRRHGAVVVGYTSGESDRQSVG